jgi:hypothetical protein
MLIFGCETLLHLLMFLGSLKKAVNVKPHIFYNKIVKYESLVSKHGMEIYRDSLTLNPMLRSDLHFDGTHHVIIQSP